MEDLFKAIILGLVQGLSEFLPISSSGHLVLFGELLNYQEAGIALEVFVHFGTLISVFICFRKDIWEMVRWLPKVPEFILNGMHVRSEEDKYKAMSAYIVIGSVPAAIAGLLLKDHIESIFTPVVVLFTLSITALILFSSRYTEESQPFLTWKHAILIGCVQAFAILPGISRSGATIIMALWLGVQRETAAKFSFLLSIPVILGASILQFADMLSAPPSGSELISLFAATVAAAVSGYFAIVWLMEVVKKQQLEWFALYCAIVSVVGGAIYFMQ
ncbi:MAG: undecaprenyl-diphosphate phosphatase [Calditrichia bacterium]